MKNIRTVMQRKKDQDETVTVGKQKRETCSSLKTETRREEEEAEVAEGTLEGCNDRRRTKQEIRSRIRW